MTKDPSSDVNDLYVRLLEFEIKQDICRAIECLENGDHGGYVRASLRVQVAMESLEKAEDA